MFTYDLKPVFLLTYPEQPQRCKVSYEDDPAQDLSPCPCCATADSISCYHQCEDMRSTEEQLKRKNRQHLTDPDFLLFSQLVARISCTDTKSAAECCINTCQQGSKRDRVGVPLLVVSLFHRSGHFTNHYTTEAQSWDKLKSPAPFVCVERTCVTV